MRYSCRPTPRVGGPLLRGAVLSRKPAGPGGARSAVLVPWFSEPPRYLTVNAEDLAYVIFGSDVGASEVKSTKGLDRTKFE